MTEQEGLRDFLGLYKGQKGRCLAKSPEDARDILSKMWRDCNPKDIKLYEAKFDAMWELVS